ncbi:MAG: hypothetical protein M3Y56_02335, partial [Armatimonadota bacterium]|nr:hypothetical protein [Armatimonadota bacterium]
SLLGSDWYCQREKARQVVDTGLWLQHVHYLEQFLTRTNYAAEAERLHIKDRLAYAKEMLEKVKGASPL